MDFFSTFICFFVIVIIFFIIFIRLYYLILKFRFLKSGIDYFNSHTVILNNNKSTDDINLN